MGKRKLFNYNFTIVLKLFPELSVNGIDNINKSLSKSLL